MTRTPHRRTLPALLVCLAAIAAAAAGDTLEVVAVTPPAHATGAAIHTPIVVHFDRPVDPASITTDATLWAFGRWSGAVGGSYGFSNGDRTVTLTPDRPFSAGENVMVLLSNQIQGADGSPLRAAGYSYQFWTRALPAPNQFVEIDRLTTRTSPGSSSQAYGGVGTDLDADGFMDVAVVNEITEDIRVFLNRAEGNGLVDPFIQPPFLVGDRASPSEPSDFNRDGHADLCVANIDDDTVSILLGNGDGSFAPQQQIAVGDAPRGIAALDVDGDGDVDVVNTNSFAGPLNMSVLLNDGNGVFGPPTFFEAGALGAWALAAADMNDDAILDLVVGSRSAERVYVHLGNGDGSFAPNGGSEASGGIWMLVLGDVNGDGTEDVATANGTSNNADIFLGDGAGGLGPAEEYDVDNFALATDLGDLDGDGDLDWLTASFSGDWLLFANDGAGSFTLEQSFEPVSAASCSLMLDLDNDRDLDLALIDEIADELILMRNGATASPLASPDVPAGEAGSAPLTVGKLDTVASALSIAWDTVSCDAVEYHLVFGGGSQLPAAPGGTLALSGSRCGIGTNQPFQWLAAPGPLDSTGLVWFLMLANDGVDTEGSWGTDSGGLQRVGPGPAGSSGECFVAAKDATSSCTN